MTDDTSGAVREWRVTGMDCASCAGKIRDAVGRLPGVSGVEVAIMSERLKLTLDEGQGAPEAVEATVRKLGFGIEPRAEARPFVLPDASAEGSCGCGGACASGAPHAQDPGHGHSHSHEAAEPGAWYLTAKGRLVLLTGVLLACAWTVEALVPGPVGPVAFALACLIGLVPIARRAWAALRLGQPFTIEGLMTVAAAGALFIGAAEEAALVIFLFAVGEVLEGVAASRARDGIRALSRLVPETARLERDGRAVEVPAAGLRPGQIVRVRPGERLPADGEILEGQGGIDESPVTGESIPVTRGPGEAVFAGAVATDAALRIRVTRAAKDNTIARIVRLVEEAEEARAPTERFIDRFSRWYMPLIVGLAVAVAVLPPLAAGADWSTWIYRGLALLLIGCPCALVISVPAAIASALASGARRGLLMKGGAVIEAAAAVRQVAFDKTGTLTRGRPEVTDVVTLSGEAEVRVLALAAAVERGSAHPLAQAILARAEAAGAPELPAEAARSLAGRGGEARVEGEPFWVASPSFAAERGVLDAGTRARAEALEAEGKTVTVLFREGRALGLLALRDEPRADAAEAVRQLGRMGVSATILTGDNARTAEAIAARLGTGFRAQMRPEDKLAAIREMAGQGGVMMIGDGINDAPALKAASVGVAMGSGTDVALETADAAILRDRVTDVPAQIRLARAAMRNIRQNIAVALGLKGVFLVTSVLGITGLWIAILADTGATVLVTLNALRLLRFDPEARG
ncbi:heavy metal translocating P-type ATPase [Cereibacter johrii]|uniref:heavy metal translocating P-type ATPase n=1 Tax=Cereibacter johrii TaxID=445629 RepID=UPI002B262AAD|nr:heavy metal translocating P-type ATPase [Cereibacter johrii]MEA5161894.1 heavy metal translocating P-type ATPase [Cereibacter johrii]